MAHDVERERAWSIRTPKNRIRVLNLNMQIFGGNGFFLSIYLCVHFLGRFRSLSTSLAPLPLLIVIFAPNPKAVVRGVYIYSSIYVCS